MNFSIALSTIFRTDLACINFSITIFTDANQDEIISFCIFWSSFRSLIKLKRPKAKTYVVSEQFFSSRPVCCFLIDLEIAKLTIF